MPWLRFTGDFDFRPKPAVTIAYLAGQVRLVTTSCSITAITAGKAVKSTKPRSDDA